jgi:hypothetical protein
MKREERRQLGMALAGDSVRRDVMQTVVSFSDHQVLSPGCSEEEARRSLKCCIFGGLMRYVRDRTRSAREVAGDLENRLKALRGRQRRLDADDSSREDAARTQSQIEALEQELAQQDLRLASSADLLAFLEDVLENPAQYLSSCSCSIRLSRLGVKLETDAEGDGYEVPLSEIRIASQEPRVGLLARFPRSELLPRKDFIARADLFLAL